MTLRILPFLTRRDVPVDLVVVDPAVGGVAGRPAEEQRDERVLVHRVRDEVDRRRVLVTPNTDAIMGRVGRVYGRVGARWNAYLETLTDDQIAFATEIISQATTINREEVEALRSAE